MVNGFKTSLSVMDIRNYQNTEQHIKFKTVTLISNLNLIFDTRLYHMKMRLLLRVK
jgi:hypothetical protein